MRSFSCRQHMCGAPSRCSRSLLAERISLIAEAELVVPRSRKITPNRLIKRPFWDVGPRISGVRSRSWLFLYTSGCAKIVCAEPPTP